MDAEEKRRRAKVLDDLRSYYGKGIELRDEKAFLKTLKGESDRGYVILLVSFMEDALLDRILRALPKGDALKKSLVKSGPLRSIENRIKLALALEVINETDAAVLDTFREMRNACAHSRQHISFETPELVETLGLMLSPETRSQMSGVSPSTMKMAFEICASFMLSRLHGQKNSEALENVNSALKDVLGDDSTILSLHGSWPETPENR